MDNKISTLHPEEGKAGFTIDKDKYNVIRDSIIACLMLEGKLDYTDLSNCVHERVGSDFEGSIQWYTEVVKLDLEARKIIERVPNTKPQFYRLAGKY